MILNNAEVCLDLHAVLEKGVSAWQRNFFWPSSTHDYDALEGELQAGYKRIVASCDNPEMQQVLLGGGHILPLEFGLVLMALKNYRVFQALACRPIASSRSDLYRALIDDTPIPGPLMTGKWRIPNIRWKRFISDPANLYFSWKYNLGSGKLSGGKRLRFNRQVVALYKPAPLCKSYIESLEDWVRIRIIASWFGGGSGFVLPRDVAKRIEQVAGDATFCMVKAAKQQGVEAGEETVTHLKDVAVSVLTRVAEDLARLRGVFRNRGPVEYLGVSGTNYYSRIVSLIVREMGGKVTAFNHGADTCRHLRDYSLAEFSTCDLFGLENSNNIPLFKETLKVFPPPLKNSVEFIPICDDSLERVWRTFKAQPLPARVRRVMVIGACYQGDRVFYAKHPDLIRLDLEWRVIDLLRRSGYEILYKRHPGGIMRGQIIDFFPNDVQIVNEPFEAVMDQADAFLFNATITSTLGQALCTNKPIIYLHMGTEKWFPEPLTLFTKRVHIISGRSDDNNRLVFNEEELLQALATRPTEPDEEFLRRHILSNVML
jgi:hypothetical protein